nr:T9SS type A sorting domain-containing protein [Chitinispirillaceae bacterium]
RNVAHKISAGGIDWLIISIMRFPGSAEVSWAEGLIKAHPAKKVIIVNHTLNLGDGTVVWNMAKKYSNVAFLFLGHNVVMHEMLKANDGHNVGRVQTCWHSPDKDHYFCLVELNTDNGTGNFSYYSPLNANYTGEKWTWTGLPKASVVGVAQGGNAAVMSRQISVSPNPFVQNMLITLSGSADEIMVTNLRGEVVWQKKIQASAKTSSVVWNGLDRTNTEVAPGSYIMQIRSAGKTLGTEMLMKSSAQ